MLGPLCLKVNESNFDTFKKKRSNIAFSVNRFSSFSEFSNAFFIFLPPLLPNNPIEMKSLEGSLRHIFLAEILPLNLIRLPKKKKKSFLGVIRASTITRKQNLAKIRNLMNVVVEDSNLTFVLLLYLSHCKKELRKCSNSTLLVEIG